VGYYSFFARTERQYSDRNCQWYKIRVPLCVMKYFQTARGPLKSWTLALQGPFITQSKLKCKGKMGDKFPANATLSRDKAAGDMTCCGQRLVRLSILTSNPSLTHAPTIYTYILRQLAQKGRFSAQSSNGTLCFVEYV
jgi:hypothetical protein